MQALPISGLVNVTVSVAQAAAQTQNTTTLMVLTPNPLIDTVSRSASFSSLASVANFFGSQGMEAACATLWFGQTPSPASISFGRWVQTASHGQLIGQPLSASAQAIINFSGIAEGSFAISVDGATLKNIDNVSLIGVANLNAVAQAVNVQLAANSTGATCLWTGSSFVFTSGTTGALSGVSFLAPAATLAGQTDISALLGGQQASSGCYVTPGLAAELALTAVQILDNNFGQSFYALVAPGVADPDHLAISAYLQATSTKHFYGVTTQEAAVLTSQSVTDVAYLLAQTNATKTAVQYSSTNPYAIISLLGRVLTVNYTANSSVLTLMYEQEPLVIADYLTRTQLAAMLSKNCNVFVNYQGGVQIIQPGTTCATNQFIDTIIGLDNLAISYQAALFNVLYSTTTKIPQTDAGMHRLLSAGEVILNQFAVDGLLAPGLWSNPGFGALNFQDILEKGYYSYAPPVATQSASNRAARMAVPFQIAVKLAGAVQTISAILNVNP